MVRPSPKHITDLSVHNLSTIDLTPDDISLLTKGLSFSMTPTKPKITQYAELMIQFNQFARSLRPIYVHATYQPLNKMSPSSQPLAQNKDPQRSFLYRRMKFLPKCTHSSFTQTYSGHPRLETYIDRTRVNLEENMSSLFKSKSNLTKQERQVLCNLKQKKVEIMLKPADKNLGIVILSTDDYLHLCTQQLADASTYRQCTGYPKETISTKIKETVSRFTSHVKSIHKQLYDFLTPHPRHQPSMAYQKSIKHSPACHHLDQLSRTVIHLCLHQHILLTTSSSL